MKIVCISDTHEKHKQLDLPDGDVLIHAGDFTWVGNEKGRNLHYLMNSEVVLDHGVRIWGSPFTPEFMNWAFMGTPATLKPIWDKIPSSLDILITHGPPYQILDRTMQGLSVGCPLLLEKVMAVKPKYHVFGHIHEGYGVREKNGVTFINASICNADYDLVNQPVVIELKPSRKENEKN